MLIEYKHKTLKTDYNQEIDDEIIMVFTKETLQ
jgi:hypothetical protein